MLMKSESLKQLGDTKNCAGVAAEADTYSHPRAVQCNGNHTSGGIRVLPPRRLGKYEEERKMEQSTNEGNFTSTEPR